MLLGQVLLAAFLTFVYLFRGRRGFVASERGLDPAKAVAGLSVGAAAAAVLMAASIGVFWAAGWYRIESVRFDPAGLLYSSAFFAAVSVAEEVLARGMVWRIVERFSSAPVALVASALFFGAAHFLNPDATIYSSLAIAAHAGLFLGSLFLVTRSLWLPIGAHFSWNVVEGPVLGAPVSGFDFDSLTEATIDGPPALTGGEFGPEAGLVTVIAGLAGTAAVLIYGRRIRRLRPATTSREPSGPEPPTSQDPPAPAP